MTNNIFMSFDDSYYAEHEILHGVALLIATLTTQIPISVFKCV